MKIKFSGIEVVAAGTPEEVREFGKFVDELMSDERPHKRITGVVAGIDDNVWTKKELDEMADKAIEETLAGYKDEDLNGKETK